MTSIIIISGPWPESENIFLTQLCHIPRAGDEFNFTLRGGKKQMEIIKSLKEITHQPCRVASVSHEIHYNMQQVKIHLYCGELIEKKKQ
jgi:hypothetical protein